MNIHDIILGKIYNILVASIRTMHLVGSEGRGHLEGCDGRGPEVMWDW